jgi:hypothetical protein
VAAKEHEDDKQREHRVDQDAIGAIGFFFDGLGHPRLAQAQNRQGKDSQKK